MRVAGINARESINELRARAMAAEALDSTTIDDVIEKLLARDDMRVKEHNRVKDIKHKPRDKWTVNDVKDLLHLYQTYQSPPTRG